MVGVCGERLVLPINSDGDMLLCVEPEANPAFVAHVTKAVCDLPPQHAGDHASSSGYGVVPVSWARGQPTGVGWPA